MRVRPGSILTISICAMATALACKGGRARVQDLPDSSPEWFARPATDPVLVVESGDEPRSKLRYRFRAGQVEVCKTTSSYAYAASGDAVAPPVSDFDARVSVEASLVDADGTARFDAKIVDAVLNRKRTALDTLEGILGVLVVDSRGLPLHAELAGHAALGSAEQQWLDVVWRGATEMPAPLPDAPVGVGARWTYTRSVLHAGSTFVATTEYQLVRSANGELTLVTSFTATSPPTGSQDAYGTRTTGTGRRTVDLARLCPSSAKGAYRGDWATIDDPGTVKEKRTAWNVRARVEASSE
jgi:hypothetical protein